MYSSLSQFKSYLWIPSSDTSKDEQLTMILNSACATINKICWVDSFDEWTYEEEIDARKIYINSFWYNIFLKNKPVSSIDKINGENYSGVKGSDYMISQQRRAIFKKFDWINDFWFVTITYTAWYNRARTEWQTTIDDLPDDLKMLEMMVACWYLPDNLKEEYHVWISSYKLWDEQIVFGAKSSANTQSADDLYFSFSYMIDKYKNFNLAI
jgi:hypothetical protein